MQTPPLIAYAQVGKSFGGGRGAERVLAVDEVSLDVTAGEFLAIVGGSGSGKTTLLRLANRLIDADSGGIRSKARMCARSIRSRCAAASAMCSRAADCSAV
jgi:osmoprotectant transport system ATP-binding protein